MSQIVLHSDLNCFYAAVEMMLDPSLKGKAVAVCGSTENRHGIVLAKSYPAKAKGVKTGQANWEARQACPGLICAPPQYDQYLKYSRLVRAIYARYADDIEPFGIPVYAGIWRPTASGQNPPPQYAVYATTTTEDIHLDDAVVSYKTFVYLSLWSDGDPTDTATRIRNAMYAAGFIMVEETDMGYNQPAYDSATRQYNLHWTWCLRTRASTEDGDDL